MKFVRMFIYLLGGLIGLTFLSLFLLLLTTNAILLAN